MSSAPGNVGRIASLPPQQEDASPAGKRILLISRTIPHYRVQVYNYFHSRFNEIGCEFAVLASHVQPQSRNRVNFELYQRPFDFISYRRAIQTFVPHGVILFLRLRYATSWLLMRWLKLARI